MDSNSTHRQCRIPAARRRALGGLEIVLRPLAILVAALLMTAKGVPQHPMVVVVTLNEVEAYEQALRGIREKLPDVQVWDARDENQLRENFAKTLPALAIAVGTSAAASLERVAPAQLALVNSVVLAGDELGEGKPRSRFKTTVTIDVAPDALLAEVARLFPGKSRIGVIRGPLQSDAYMKAFEQAARRRGLSVEAITCLHSRDLVEVFLSLHSRADLVWCPPNPHLYTSATLKPLLVASITNRLPIIGYSEQFVQAGALFGGVADFVDVGRQTAALAFRVARDEPVPVREEARKFRFTYNQRVARLVGMKAVIPEGEGSELNIIR